MKKLLLIAAFTLSLTGCVAQEAAKPKIVEGPLTVLSVYEGENTATLKSLKTCHSFTVDANELIIGWEYYFLLEVRESNGCKTQQAVIRAHAITPRQANINLAKMKQQFQAANPDASK